MRLIIFILLLAAFFQCRTNSKFQEKKMNCADDNIMVINTVIDSLESIIYPPIEEFKNKRKDSIYFFDNYTIWGSAKRFSDILLPRDSSLIHITSFENESIVNLDCIKNHSWRHINIISEYDKNLQDMLMISKPLFIDTRCYIEITFIYDKTFLTGYLIRLSKKAKVWQIEELFQNAVS